MASYLGERRLGVVSGTLGGSMAMSWRQCELRSRLVSLARWAADEGVSWSAPGQPAVTRGPSLADLVSD